MYSDVCRFCNVAVPEPMRRSDLHGRRPRAGPGSALGAHGTQHRLHVADELVAGTRPAERRDRR